MNVYLGRVEAEAVTTAIGYRTGREGGIFNVATPAEHRRHGYGAAITAFATRSLFESGADLAWLQTSPIGERVYHRLDSVRSPTTFCSAGRTPRARDIWWASSTRPSQTPAPGRSGDIPEAGPLDDEPVSFERRSTRADLAGHYRVVFIPDCLAVSCKR